MTLTMSPFSHYVMICQPNYCTTSISKKMLIPKEVIAIGIGIILQRKWDAAWPISSSFPRLVYLKRHPLQAENSKEGQRGT